MLHDIGLNAILAFIFGAASDGRLSGRSVLRLRAQLAAAAGGACRCKPEPAVALQTQLAKVRQTN